MKLLALSLLTGTLILLVVLAVSTHAATITHAPSDPCAFTPCQHWYTTYIPTDTGVYPLEVYTPSLPRVWSSSPLVELGEPPLPSSMETPEPGAGWLAFVPLTIFLVYIITLPLLINWAATSASRKARKEKSK